MRPEIKLESRGGIDNRLVQVKGESLKFELKTEYNYRVGLKDNEGDRRTCCESHT